MADMPRFPDEFAWGVATSAFQIEGAVTEDGRGQSIWDTFSHSAGTIRDGHVADVACDHYHRLGEDVALLKSLGIDIYRFSISWPRILPTGASTHNPKGLDFYDRLIDALLDNGITPMPTLYHWDLPQALEDTGGWLNRDTADRFGEYAAVVGARYGDRVRDWITLNEPFEHMALGYSLGQHAPGRQLLLDALPVAHHQLLAHGKAVKALRACGGQRILLTNSYSPAVPASSSTADIDAAHAYDTLHRGLFTDPVLLGRYPDMSMFGIDATDLPFVMAGDLDIIAQPLDGLGVNYYNPTKVAAPGPESPLPFEFTEFDDAPKTDFHWPVIPEGMTQTLMDLTGRYGDKLPPLWITENGCSYHVEPDANGVIDDRDRISYLDTHIKAVRQAIDNGADVRGYLLWTLMDNFEWAEGYHQRFGLVHVDHDTQRRTPKASFGWFQSMIAEQRS